VLQKRTFTSKREAVEVEDLTGLSSTLQNVTENVSWLLV
jgi:hypothetical protein